MKKELIEPGRRFHSLTIIKETDPYVSPGGAKSRRFVVRCNCGRLKTVILNTMKTGHTKSCGCLFASPRPTTEPAPIDGSRWLPLTKGKWTLVDEDVFESLRCRRLWIGTSGYAMMTKPHSRSLQRVHRFIVGLGDDLSTLVDHINGDRLDNRRANLRTASAKQNTRNSRPQGQRPYKGVTFQKGKWVAQIGVDGRRVYLGRHTTIIEAARAYNAAAKRLHGEFAWLNPISGAVD